MARKKRWNVPLLLAVLALAGLALAYVLEPPLREALLGSHDPLPARITRWSLRHEIRVRIVDLLLLAWVFAVGGCIGSFLNVVVYRAPRGRSLLGSSRCPSCCTPIRPSDNVPIFGWLKLRGRCRCCRLPISPRYPLVELTVAVIFLALALTEVLHAGVNLPIPEPAGASRSRLHWLVWELPLPLVATAFYHAVLLSGLLSWILIVADGFRVPPVYLGLVLAVGVTGGVLVPAVQPIPCCPGLGDAGLLSPPWNRIVAGLSAALAGALLGGVMNRLHFGWGFARRGWAPGIAATSAFLGWQAALASAAAAALATAGLSCLRPFRPRAAEAVPLLFPAVAAHVLVWRWLDDLTWWPGSHAQGGVLIGWCGAAVLSAWLCGRLQPAGAARPESTTADRPPSGGTAQAQAGRVPAETEEVRQENGGIGRD